MQRTTGKQREIGTTTLIRNCRQKGVDWQFTIGDARIKLKHPYPVIEIKNKMLQTTSEHL